MKFANKIPESGLRPVVESVPIKAEGNWAGGCPVSNTGPILLYACVLVLPITVLTTTFLALVYTHSVHQDVGLIYQLPPTADTDYFYVAIKSSWLIFIISRTSTFAPFIAGFSASLASFQIAKRLFNDTIIGNYVNCLTPYQLVIAIKLLAGSSLCGFISIYKHITGAKQRTAFVTILRILIGVAIASFTLRYTS